MVGRGVGAAVRDSSGAGAAADGVAAAGVPVTALLAGVAGAEPRVAQAASSKAEISTARVWRVRAAIGITSFYEYGAGFALRLSLGRIHPTGECVFWRIPAKRSRVYRRGVIGGDCDGVIDGIVRT